MPQLTWLLLVHVTISLTQKMRGHTQGHLLCTMLLINLVYISKSLETVAYPTDT